MRYLYGLILILTAFVSFSQSEIRKPDFPGNLSFDIGFNIWSKMPKGTDRETWPSKSFGMYYQNRKGLFNKFSFIYGLGLTMEKIGLGDSTLIQNNGKITIDTIPSTQISNITKNKLAIMYMELPLELRFHPKGTIDGEGLFISAGPMIGLRLSSHTKWKYGDTIEKIKNKFNLNPVRYGFQARVGFKGVHLFYKQYLSETFNDEIGGSNPTLTTVGITFTGF